MANRTEISPSTKWRVEQLTFGGERVSHLYPNDCYYAHLSIYYFASQFTQGKRVLDAGSGAGYGSAYLAEHGADFVQALDISEQGVAFSRHCFQRPNLNYRVMDLQGISGFPDHRFDVIFSSNALEHVPNVQAFFQSAWRLASADGVLIIGVPPVVNEASRDANLANPYHLNIWSPRQWQHVLASYFKNVQPYRHSFERQDVKLDFNRTPEQTRINEQDFRFDEIPLERFYQEETLTVIFVARRPRPESELPRVNEPILFVDDSFTRPLVLADEMKDGIENLSVPVPSHPSAGQLVNRAIAIIRQQGVSSLVRRAVAYCRRARAFEVAHRLARR